MNVADVDFADVQGLVRFGYRKMTKAVYLLVRVKDATAARAWLRTAPVANAVLQNPPPQTALHIALTAPGLRALGVAEAVIADFSHEFRTGMAEDYRARQLGDVGSNAPAHWAWGNAAREPHLVVMFFAEPDRFTSFVAETKGTSWARAFDDLQQLGTSDLNDTEPFGFHDGVSQPAIDWEQKRTTPCTQLDYTNCVSLGEILLGYRNEYGKITDRPLLAPPQADADLLPALDAPEKKDLGRNGTYLVMRQLNQDVRKFWQFLHEQSEGNTPAAEQLAERMIGRTKAGDPLVPSRAQPIEGVGPDANEVRQNQFSFDEDSTGSGCPFGAHIRRANPRNGDFARRPSGILQKLITMLGFGPKGFRDDVMSSVRFHRILRRGREYGSKLSSADALAPAPAGEQPRGLHFICLNAAIGRQFEFLQNAWLASTKFSALAGESDPLLGTRQPVPGCLVTSNFTIQRDGALPRRVTGLPQFVTVRGGAYFFLPSLRALRYFTRES